MREVSVIQVPAGAYIIDVRETDEYNAVHARGVQHIPMGEIPHRLNEINTDEDIYVICQAGMRSAKVVEFLATQGIEAINIAGGTNAWLEANLPHEIPTDN